MVSIIPADPKNPDVVCLLLKSHKIMESLFPSEDNNYLSVQELTAEHIHFFAAELNGNIVGTGALSAQHGYGEIKSLFVDRPARGHGIAEAMMKQLEECAREAGLPIIYLETGNKLNAAVRLYGRLGYEFCGPFGSYKENATSLFMKKSLA